ncbi:MAG: DUF2071 domain-containing protein [Roseimicrobium sp.]
MAAESTECSARTPRVWLTLSLGSAEYLHEHERGVLYGTVMARKGPGQLRYRASVKEPFSPCAPRTLDEFLMERYYAFTDWRGWQRRFRVAHQPWPQCAVEAEILEDRLLEQTGPWFQRARFIGANYSPGLSDVVMSFPSQA